MHVNLQKTYTKAGKWGLLKSDPNWRRMRDAGWEKREQRPDRWRDSKEITAGCLDSSPSNPAFIHLFLPPSLPSTTQSSTLQTAALLSNITHAAAALIMSRRDRCDEFLNNLSASSPGEGRRKGGRRNGGDKGHFMFSLSCIKQGKMTNGLEVVAEGRRHRDREKNELRRV